MPQVTQTPDARSTNGAANELQEWRTHARVFLQPIAAPSILAVHGIWAAFWLGYGMINLLIAVKAVPTPARTRRCPSSGTASSGALRGAPRRPAECSGSTWPGTPGRGSRR